MVQHMLERILELVLQFTLGKCNTYRRNHNITSRTIESKASMCTTNSYYDIAISVSTHIKALFDASK